MSETVLVVPCDCGAWSRDGLCGPCDAVERQLPRGTTVDVWEDGVGFLGVRVVGVRDGTAVTVPVDGWVGEFERECARFDARRGES